ncbi:5-dehydro-4-deoxyglucarate dehydratase [Rosistilla ulvae]|uniref:5-dehydro-4-deoxyglucarate dehydratase n=1 Tax=Rosistilla ulvae TaxID=1930277 RepID=A0A517M0K0_9BACT|nr:dihydrodipicolinate synthase family protein [Rosistilla ulvae]QDS88396.1 5-dehydro-4-deoxyglucarate dehydratase [Rosistilla ulvae]
MQTTPVTYENLRDSIIAVPPLCRDADYRICKTENQKVVRHIEAGGVSSLLYGGNANLYHVRVSEFADLLNTLSEIAADNTLVVPSVGPAYGMMMDQADIIRDTKFPTVMVLPAEGVMTEQGLLRGFRHFVEAIGRPAVLYIKREGYISPQGAAKLVDDGLVSFIKYAIVRDDPSVDPFLTELVDCVDRKLIVSGIGEQPAIVHLKQFGITGFTSGCVCVAPGLSQQMLQALYADDLDKAESIRQTFLPLEDLRNEINPIRVLHQAVASAGIAQTGPQIPLLDEIDPARVDEIRDAASALMAAGK